MKRWLSSLIVLSSCLGCGQQEQKPLLEHAELGVFFGGEIQERSELALILDRAVQAQGFRLRFSEPLTEPLTVRWEIDMPGAGRRVRDTSGRRGYGRLTRVAEAEARTGLRLFEQEIRFVPEDSPGTWNVRVRVGDQLALDRSVWVYDAVKRRRDERAERARIDEERTAELLPKARK
jgi:hypothetical protein